jgi:hypothetical protein
MDEISFFYIRIMEGFSTAPQLSSAPIVTTIVAGTNVTIDPVDGIGSVTINAPGGGPGGGVLSLAGLEGIVTLSSPGDTIAIVVDGQDITLESSGVATATAGDGISIDGTTDITIANTGVLSISDGSKSPSTGAIVLSAGDGVSIDDTDGTFAITNTGVTDLTGGDGIGIDQQTGSITISNLGLLSASAGDAGIGAVTTSGALSITNKGVRTLADLSGAIVLSAGTGIGVVTSIETNTITLSNTGLASASAGAGIFISTSSGVATISNTGVRTLNDLSGAVLLSAGDGIQLDNNSGAGPLTIDNTGALSVAGITGVITLTSSDDSITITPDAQNIDLIAVIPAPPVESVGGKTGEVTFAEGTGISITYGSANADPITINTSVVGIVTSGTIDQTGFDIETTGPATGQYYKDVTITGMQANGIVVATTSGTPSICSSAWITSVIPKADAITIWLAGDPVATGETWQAHYVVASYGTAP